MVDDVEEVREEKGGNMWMERERFVVDLLNL
jgi:hypothetical protein